MPRSVASTQVVVQPMAEHGNRAVFSWSRELQRVVRAGRRLALQTCPLKLEQPCSSCTAPADGITRTVETTISIHLI